MRKYVIMSYDIHALGGCQNYIYGKTRYLEDRGWCVYVLFAGPKHLHKFAFPLEKYEDGNIPGLDWIPAQLPKIIQKIIITAMLAKIDFRDEDNIIIESHYDKTHLWGELLAQKVQGKHMCFNCNELFRGDDKFYECYFDYYKFKYDRNELFGIMTTSIKSLFDGFLDIPNQKRFIAATPDPVQDIPYSIQLPISDWNICYIGRANKNYVDEVIKGMYVFARSHPDKKINYIFIGDTSNKEPFINNTLSVCPNTTIVLLGDLVPIPRTLMKLMNASIAGAGCSRCTYREGVPTIIPDPNTGRSNGIYGYETDSTLYGNPKRQFSFEESLERALVNCICQKMELLFLPPLLSSCDIYNDHMEMIEESIQEQNYYQPEKILANELFNKSSFIHQAKLLLDYLHRNL